MFKKGDIVRCIDFMEDTDKEHFTLGEEYKVLRSRNNASGDFYTINDNGDEWYVYSECFELVNKEPPKNDIEWMDRVQRNFQE